MWDNYERIYIRVFHLNGDPRYRHTTYHGHGLDKAWDIFCKRFTGMLSICDECFDNVDELSVSCRCDMFDHFVGKRWLCIACLSKRPRQTQMYLVGRWLRVGAPFLRIAKNSLVFPISSATYTKRTHPSFF